MESTVKTRTRRRIISERRFLFVAPPFPASESIPLVTAALEDTLAAAQQAQLTLVLARDSVAEKLLTSPSAQFTMVSSFTEALSTFSPITACVIRGDVPHLPAAFLAEAFGRLAHPDTDLVLGPLEKDGYYLIGAKTSMIERLTTIPWNSPELFMSVPELIHDRSIRIAFLPKWYHLGSMTDLHRLQQDLLEGTAIAPGTATVLELYRQYTEVNNGNNSEITDHTRKEIVL